MHSRAYDVIVVGAGHAGCEAALASARMGCETLIITMTRATIAHMPCNPAIGGVAKGALVKEIDALGGEMGFAADETGIHFRTLNRSKGPAVWGTRCQSDMLRYRQRMQQALNNQPRLSIVEAEVQGLLICKPKALHAGLKATAGRIEIEGVLAGGRAYHSKTVVITTGTFLNGRIHIGKRSQAAGRANEAPANYLGGALAQLGLEVGRLKTGTVPRLNTHSIAWHKLEEQWGDEPIPKFSFWDSTIPLAQTCCHITHTNPNTHRVIQKNLQHSALYGGAIQGVGPRYCPSIEDKVVKFPDRQRHQVFLEPTTLEGDETYPNGLSTSLPQEIQLAYLQTIVGLEEVEILKAGYAVEYTFVQPIQLSSSLAVKTCPQLFLGGQINGTTGYEEAAAQGLMAGINAALWVQKAKPFVLHRHEAMIGVMIDDLITKGVDEPYRMFTSRAELRLHLREDNADRRLSECSFALGLLPKERILQLRQKQRRIHALSSALGQVKVTPTLAMNQGLRGMGQAVLKTAAQASDLLCRPGITLTDLRFIPKVKALITQQNPPQNVSAQVETDFKYLGYLERQRNQVASFKHLETRSIPLNPPYAMIAGLSNEVVQKLVRHQPCTLGQATRISGITPAAIMVLDAWLKSRQAST